MQNFINDLIKTVESMEESKLCYIYRFTSTDTSVVSHADPQTTVQAFINLIQRHEQSFYNFVHKVHSKGEGLFESLMHWIELFLTVVREGLGEPISLEFLLPHKGKERSEIIAEVDKVAVHHYKLKVLYEDKLRRRFGRAQGNNGQSEADAEDEATQVLVNSVVGEISFGELASGDAIDLAAEETDEEEDSSSEEYSSSEYETGSEGDSDESESTQESTRQMPPPALPPKSPSTSGHHQQIHRSSHHHHSNVRADTIQRSATNRSSTPQPSQPRKRSLSLRSIRSMGSLSNLSLSRRSHDVPPVPSLPSTSKSATTPYSKPLPPSPMSTNFPNGTTPPPIPAKHRPDQRAKESRTETPPPQQPSVLPKEVTGLKKKKDVQALQPPELHHIPKLLPVFVELVSMCPS